jgi:hypothetical protein
MTIPNTTTMLGASSASANRPSRVRARQLVPLTGASAPAGGEGRGSGGHQRRPRVASQ